MSDENFVTQDKKNVHVLCFNNEVILFHQVMK